MAQPEKLSVAALERIYLAQIRPAFLDAAHPSAAPTAVLVVGQAGSGRNYAAEQVRSNLAQEGRTPVVVSAAEIRRFHPAWRTASTDGGTAANTDEAIGRWYADLVDDAIDRRLDLVLSSSFRQPQLAMAFATNFRAAGYSIAAVAMATDRDQSRLAAVAQYDLAMEIGLVPHAVSATEHDEAYNRLPELVSRLERDRAVDRLQIVTRDGRLLYANQVNQAGQWEHDPGGADRLNDYRARNRTPQELATSALRWQTLAQRLTRNHDVPREFAAQTVAWRNEAVQRAERDPEAAVLLQRGREAEAFRVMDRQQLLAEFPHLAKAVAKWDEAQQYAAKTLPSAEEQARFLAQARQRIAERIAEGRIPVESRNPKERPPRAR